MSVVKNIGDGYSNMVPFRGTGAYRRDMRPDFITEKHVFLSGFVDEAENVTYESHNFWIEFEQFSTREGIYRAVITVVHGGGVRQLTVEYGIAEALNVLIREGYSQLAFKMCWRLFDLSDVAYATGASDTRRDIYKAFTEGRLKKRKKPGRDAFKVWIDSQSG